MTILADSSYLQNDLSRLKRNSYGQRDKEFSGFVFYSTPAGQLLNGWHYSNGKLDKTVSVAVPQTGSVQQTQNAKVKIRDTECGTSVFFIYTGSGTITAGGSDGYVTYFFDEYIFDSCAEDMSFQQDPGNGGNGFAPPDGSGAPSSVPVDVNIKTDSLAKHFPCAVALVINNLAGCGVYSSFVQAFTTSRKPDLTWQDSTLAWAGTGSGTFELGKTAYDGRSAIITLNTSMLQNSSLLLIEAAAVHETLHAYINYNIETAVGGFQQGYNPAGTWFYAIDTWATINGLPTNYRDHYEMLSDYFNQAVTALAQLNNYAHTTLQYEEAMLYGLNNSNGPSVTPAQQALLQTEFNNLLSLYGISASDLNGFNQAN